MKRFMLVGSRVSEDKMTKEPVLWLTLVMLPKRTSKGTLWLPKKDEGLFQTAAIGIADAAKFDTFKKLLPGSVIDCDFGVSDFGKIYVTNCVLVKEATGIDAKILYSEK